MIGGWEGGGGAFLCVSKEEHKGGGKLTNAFQDTVKVASNVIQPSSYQNTHGSSVFNEKISVKSLLVQLNLSNYQSFNCLPEAKKFL